MKVCNIHYKQMEKADRDNTHALRAEDECRALIVQFPNSKFAPDAQQILRNVQEVLADAEFRVGSFYHNKQSHPAASNRLEAMNGQYPLFSRSDEALWMLADSYGKMGPRFREKAGSAYAKIVKDYPLSPLVDEAKKKLKELEVEIPEPDPVAVARMKYELENRETAGKMSKALGIFRKSPDTRMAAKSGAPAMDRARPSIPASVPPPAATAGAGTTDVTVGTPSDTSALDTNPDARQNPPKPEGEKTEPEAKPASTAPEPLPANRNYQPKKEKKQKEKKPSKTSSN
jgi:outer membrane protein assembly factor BamD